MTTFLNDAELIVLTDRRMKSKQIEALRNMGVPFLINASGHPVVSRTSVEGGKAEKAEKKWTPRLMRAGG